MQHGGSARRSQERLQIRRKIDELGYWQPRKTGIDWIKLDSALFPEVKWEDEEPTEVELVKKEKV